jgi:hypothetical protein
MLALLLDKVLLKKALLFFHFGEPEEVNAKGQNQFIMPS